MNMRIVRFGELYAIPSGNGLSRPTAVRGEGFRMIGMGELFANDIITDMEMDRVKMSEKEKKNFFVEEGDLLFARQSLVASGAGKCSIVKQFSEPTTYESHLIRVRLDKSKCNPWFYYYLFKLQNNPIKAIINQCAQAGIRGNELIRVKVPLVELGLQNRIVSVLLAYDNLIETNNKRIKVLEQMAENLYKEWFVHFRFPGHETAEVENGIPKGWVIQKLKGIIKRLPFGVLYKAENTEKEGKTIVIDQSQDEYVGFHNNKPSHIASIDSPVALFGDHSCKYQLMITPFSLSENVIPYIGTDDVLTTYLFYLTKGIIETTEYKRHWTEFTSKKVIVAPIDLQIIFVQCVNSFLSETHMLQEQNRNLIKQRDLLLPRLMSGKLEV